jgi:hypothetical protein
VMGVTVVGVLKGDRFIHHKTEPPVVTDARQLRSVDHSSFLTTSIHLSYFCVQRKETRLVECIHDHPLYFVCPDLLVAECETSYGIGG